MRSCRKAYTTTQWSNRRDSDPLAKIKYMTGKLSTIDEKELEESVVQLSPPSAYQVVMLNDDYTPMDFVVSILLQQFGMNEVLAVNTMMQIHHKGEAVCGTYSKDVAETKAALVMQIAREHEFPLRCITREIDTYND